ncbi:nucleotidyl transferase AbiEii/AbiGii toxin family protein [Mesorhizobium sp.]|uniref:nucleotidyl transferase AbiEii/AbiGii toxin family protein n=1 Tax=Mesorhizobium sp. TaxID=1871066 RepID=UPI000FEA4607|nr:nucleotidyl transferase AbiEii/AbiGii toxin family protein [Mesorhizobium sp.]RWK09326.1 MAG: nucleotidyl transferase AbiEii/AbiGii toxin family protein [Mesorhizobium sp.]
MPASEAYRGQVTLLVRALPLVAEEAVFALKGGTAINLFVRDLPRLSVDIDLTYLPVEDRATSLANIDAAMRRVAAQIGENVPRSRAQIVPLHSEGAVTKVLVASDGVQIKIEVTPVIRGCVYSPETRVVCDRVEELFGYAEVPVVSFPDLYAGKIVAALDRQHPRDLFDVRDLLANEGVSDELRCAFIVYMLSHNRPMAEVLAPTRKDLRQEFDAGFAGMTEEPVTLEALYDAREALIAEVVGKMPAEHRRFLLSFKAGEPDWDLLGVPGAAELPAVRWKVDNLAKLSKDRREKLLSHLGKALATQDR